MNDRVSIEIRGGVADVRLIRPEKMNALDEAMIAALAEAGERLKATRGVRVAVLSGEGRAFCSGLDTSHFGKMASGEREGASPDAGSRRDSGANALQQAIIVWREVPVPVIAAVHGFALGGGFQLSLGADLRFVAPDTRLSILEIKWGLVPDLCGVALLRRLVRDDVARELAFSGRIFDGNEAFRLGLATRLSADPRAEALAFAAEVAGKNPDAIRAIKRLFNLAVDAEQPAILAAESDEQARLVGSPNQVEAVRANLERRDPVFAD